MRALSADRVAHAGGQGWAAPVVPVVVRRMGEEGGGMPEEQALRESIEKVVLSRAVLSAIADEVIDRIEDRIIDDLERRGRRDMPRLV